MVWTIAYSISYLSLFPVKEFRWAFRGLFKVSHCWMRSESRWLYQFARAPKASLGRGDLARNYWRGYVFHIRQGG